MNHLLCHHSKNLKTLKDRVQSCLDAFQGFHADLVTFVQLNKSLELELQEEAPRLAQEKALIAQAETYLLNRLEALANGSPYQHITPWSELFPLLQVFVS